MAFSALCGYLAHVDPGTGIPLLIGGSLLPDLDHRQSFLGRIFFFLSWPLHKYFGHRGVIHGLPLWGLVALLGFFYRPLGLIGAGALSHIILDCVNVSGVKLFAPFSERIAVIFKRDWRVSTGSKNELIIMICLIVLTYGGTRLSAVGGITAMVGHLTGSPKIMLEEYQRKGLTKCTVKGKLRWKNGRIEQGEWLIIGTEGTTGLALQGEGRIIHLPADGHFLSARLQQGESQWEAVTVRGWTRTENSVYFLAGKRWKQAVAGDVVWGQILGEKIRLATAI